MRGFYLLLAAFATTGALVASPARGDEPGAVLVLDRVVARWYAPETGGVKKPQYVFERELAFEARVEALADRDQEPGTFSERHIRAALDRHVAETMLASLAIVPNPEPREIAARAEAARVVLEQRSGGRPRLLAAAAAEGIGADEVDAILRRQARASLYLDRMVAPMLEVSELELRDALRARTTPFGDQPYEQVAAPLERWYVGQKVAKALDSYYLTARGRVTLIIVR